MGENKDSIFSLMNHSIIYNVHLYAHLLNPKQYKTDDSPLWSGWEMGRGEVGWAEAEGGGAGVGM